jgi:hypothetical protein
VSWSQPGTRLTEVSRDDTKIVLRVDEVPAGGGRAALSRLPWPGYTVEGAELMERPVGGYLLGLEVPADAQGKLITISFEPPGWRIGIPVWAVAVVGMLGWSLVALRRARRDPSEQPGHVQAETVQPEEVQPEAVHEGTK